MVALTISVQQLLHLVKQRAGRGDYMVLSPDCLDVSEGQAHLMNCWVSIPRKTAIHLGGLGNQGRQGTRQNVMLGVPTPNPQSEEKWGNSLGKLGEIIHLDRGWV